MDQQIDSGSCAECGERYPWGGYGWLVAGRTLCGPCAGGTLVRHWRHPVEEFQRFPKEQVELIMKLMQTIKLVVPKG